MEEEGEAPADASVPAYRDAHWVPLAVTQVKWTVERGKDSEREAADVLTRRVMTDLLHDEVESIIYCHAK